MKIILFQISKKGFQLLTNRMQQRSNFFIFIFRFPGKILILIFLKEKHQHFFQPQNPPSTTFILFSWNEHKKFQISCFQNLSSSDFQYLPALISKNFIKRIRKSLKKRKTFVLKKLLSNFKHFIAFILSSLNFLC